ncbi:methyltransferase domain-containing protein [Microbulbifer harenosus]|uniref:Class I SAM-dependent methyltransferase n=1 Tax=Microbulbifer harenosus TaxID=2576840 RepID=A0ABY2UHF3_9GAMM|nr:methyltransferase domain-containing protein [Microbulbifer harenosus]TLM77184.1 class I SAM-dependent methyltransferase [Microbulbifer harenosus]
MHYKIKGHSIKSHNAAKPHTQSSKQVIEELEEIVVTGQILDLGCGKLRYSDYLNELSEKICFADSRVQLERMQVIKGIRCSVQEYVAKNYPSSRCVAIEDIQEVSDQFNFIFCSNVLSAIPCEKTLNATMSIIYNLLSETGRALIVNQHRSSYFKKFEMGRPHLHGYLYKGNRGSSYYGIIDKSTIEDLSRKHGFSIEAFLKGDRTFAYLTKNPSIKFEPRQ